MGGDPRLMASQKLPSFSYAEYGRTRGLEDLRVTSPDGVDAAFLRAPIKQWWAS